MTISYSNALLIQSIFHSEKEDLGAKLTHVIAYADYVNHSILTFGEFEIGLKKLAALDLVAEDKEVLATTHKFKDWWNKKFSNKKRIYPLNELDQIALYLKQLSFDFKKTLNATQIKFTEDIFEKAVLSYLDRSE